MSAIDFNKAVARLLTDAVLRHAFADDPAGVADQLSADAGTRADLKRLAAADLDFQAEVLLKKRFRQVRQLLPLTCAPAQDAAWNAFRRYAQTLWPTHTDMAAGDALAFCDYLQKEKWPVRVLERNRALFRVSQRRFALHWVTSIPTIHGDRMGVQLLFRKPNRPPCECCLYLSL